MPCHLRYDRLIHVAGLGHPGTFMMWDLELKFICCSFMAASAGPQRHVRPPDS